MSNQKQYIKSLEDEIDWKVIDQLHTATVNFSSTSLELKKLYFVLVGIAIPLIIKLAGNKLDVSLFIVVYIFTISFWFLDGFTYYYQEKLREKMDFHFNLIKERNIEHLILPNKLKQDFTIDQNRSNKGRLFRSATNYSVIFYLLVLVINTIGLMMFLIKII